jgi:hypothetical protein
VGTGALANRSDRSQKCKKISNIRCYNCHGLGHYSSECHNPSRTTTNGNGLNPNTSHVRNRHNSTYGGNDNISRYNNNGGHQINAVENVSTAIPAIAVPDALRHTTGVSLEPFPHQHVAVLNSELVAANPLPLSFLSLVLQCLTLLPHLIYPLNCVQALWQTDRIDLKNAKKSPVDSWITRTVNNNRIITQP